MIERREYARGTFLAQSSPWGLYWGGAALCADGAVRKLQRIAATADTFFSVPAAVRVHGLTVSGYVSVEPLSGSSVETEDDPAAVKFVAYSYGRNADALTEPFAFFLSHAGYSWEPATESKRAGRVRCARELASAESWSADAGLATVWEDDWSIGSHVREYGYDCEPQSCELARLVDVSTGETLETMGCVDGASDDYRRVIAAELASSYRASCDYASVYRARVAEAVELRTRKLSHKFHEGRSYETEHSA